MGSRVLAECALANEASQRSEMRWMDVMSSRGRRAAGRQWQPSRTTHGPRQLEAGPPPLWLEFDVITRKNVIYLYFTSGAVASWE